MDANIKTLQDALEWLDRSIREEAEIDGEMSNSHAIQIGFIQDMLAKLPRRNCDVGTVEEMSDRLDLFCSKYKCSGAWDSTSPECPIPEDQRGVNCAIAWAQMPYVEKEGETK